MAAALNMRRKKTLNPDVPVSEAFHVRQWGRCKGVSVVLPDACEEVDLTALEQPDQPLQLHVGRIRRRVVGKTPCSDLMGPVDLNDELTDPVFPIQSLNGSVKDVRGIEEEVADLRDLQPVPCMSWHEEAD